MVQHYEELVDQVYFSLSLKNMSDLTMNNQKLD